MTIQIIDLTDYTMKPWDGYQRYTEEDCKRVLKSVTKNLRRDYKIEKDEKPSWWYGNPWKQTWTIRRR